MFEQLKEYLKAKYDNEMAEFDAIKSQMDEIENTLKEDDSEARYQDSIKMLNKKYGLFKKGSKQYKEELEGIQAEYYEKLKEFEQTHNQYLELNKELSKRNVYIIQKKLEQLMNAQTLQDLKLTEEQATKILSGEEQF